MSTEGRIPAELWLSPFAPQNRGVEPAVEITQEGMHSVLSVFNPAWARLWLLFGRTQNYCNK